MGGRNLKIGSPKIERLPVVALTASAAIGTHDKELVEADATLGTVTCTLPDATSHIGLTIYVKKTDSGVNEVVVAASGSDTIDGQTSISLSAQYETVAVAAKTAGWSIIS